MTNNDEHQACHAMRLPEHPDAVFPPNTVLLELEWV